MTDVVALGELLIDFAAKSTDAAGYPTMAANPGGAPGNFLAAPVAQCGCCQGTNSVEPPSGRNCKSAASLRRFLLVQGGLIVRYCLLPVNRCPPRIFRLERF